MALLEWKNDYATGIASIDYEHERLIVTINSMFEQTDTVPLGDTLAEIHALVEAHFALEEKIMRDNRYADYVAHKQDHDRLLDDIRDIMDDVDMGHETNVDKNLQDRMQSWFGNHFATLDRDFHIKLGH